MAKKAALLNGGKDASLKTRLALEKIHNAIGDDDNEELDDEGKDEGRLFHSHDHSLHSMLIGITEMDDEYDDDEIGDDYNGEQYFDNGEDEFDDDGDGGGEEY